MRMRKLMLGLGLLCIIVIAICVISTVFGQAGTSIATKIQDFRAVHWSNPYPRVWIDTVGVDSASVDTSLWENITGRGGEYTVMVLADTTEGRTGRVRVEYQFGYESSSGTYQPLYDGRMPEITWWLLDILTASGNYKVYRLDNIPDPVDGMRWRTTRDDAVALSDSTLSTSIFTWRRPK